jgi:uncharacterized protein (DUF302 family)
MAVWLRTPIVGFVAMMAFIVALFLPSLVRAQALQSYQTNSSFDDVRFELTNAIIDRGLKVQSNGKVAAMLARTGAAAGSSKPIYKEAEYFSFCSVKLSRAMMEADPANVGYCPFVIFLYVSVAKPDEVTVGYQAHPKTGNAASIKAFAQIDQLLDGIAKAATQ